jgi:antagonist of KipI
MMEVIKAGVLDSFQDGGRHGFAHLGIGAGGCMDPVAGRVANLLVGNSETFALMEMHFPAPVLQFTGGAVIAFSGADFGAMANGVELPINRRVTLPAGTRLHFTRKIRGQRCYLAVEGGWQLESVLGSFSTHLKAKFGGWKGRALQKGDLIPTEKANSSPVKQPEIAKWFVYPNSFYTPSPLRVMPGPEWEWLDYEAQKKMLNEPFAITRQSDRMGYHLKGIVLESTLRDELLSSGVLPGTIQLLPGGNPLLLMADCQTTGGYPRILQVAAVDLPKLAQMGPGESIIFTLIKTDEATQLLDGYRKQLRSLQGAIPFM